MVRGGSVDIYSVSVGGELPTVFLFQDYEDAQRYVIMLEEDEDYTVGETCEMDITEVPLREAISALTEKGHRFVHIRHDELFVPPDGKLL